VRNGRFDTPKYRSKVKKQGCCTLILQRSPGPCNMQGPSKNKIKWFPKKKFKKSHALSLQAVARSRWATVGHRLLRATVVLPATAGQSTVARSRVTSGCRSLVGAWSTACDCACVGPPLLPPSSYLLPFPPTSHLNFLHMWSSVLHWLHHMPALPRLLLKTSNTHNF
jgi:hypothetical protein